jgi:uncharacterized membrane protein
MRTTALLVLATACDDHLFPSAPVEVGSCDATWASVEALFQAECVSCHPTVSSPDLLVDIPDDIASGAGDYVVAGDPEGSLLYKSLTGDGAVLMPFGATDPLPDETLTCVYDWIANGATVE